MTDQIVVRQVLGEEGSKGPWFDEGKGSPAARVVQIEGRAAGITTDRGKGSVFYPTPSGGNQEVSVFQKLK